MFAKINPVENGFLVQQVEEVPGTTQNIITRTWIAKNEGEVLSVLREMFKKIDVHTLTASEYRAGTAPSVAGPAETKDPLGPW